MRIFLSRLAGLLRRQHHDAALDEEIRAHLDLLAADYTRRGMTPDDARLAARRAFGGVEQMKERHRDRRGLRWMDDFARDVRYAARLLARAPGFTSVAVLTLALGVGANTALFSVVHEHVFKKLPVHHPDDLVTFRWVGAQDITNQLRGYTHIAGLDEGQEAGSSFSFSTIPAFREANKTLSHVFAFAPSDGLNVFGGTQAEFATGAFVSGNFYDALGVAPVAGRTLAPADDAEAAPAVAVISDSYWRRQFGSRSDVIGRVITINNVPVTIVGVVRSEIGDLTNRGFLEGPEFWLPLSAEPGLQGANSMLRNPANWWVIIMGRLAPETTIRQAEANFAPVFQQMARDGWAAHVAALSPEQRARASIQRRGTRVPTLRIAGAAHGASDLDDATVRQFMLLGGIFALGLLIVCINLANLLLSRAAARQREIAVRLSVGATRARIMRQLLVESLVLGALGAAAGWPIATAFRSLYPFASSPLVWDGPILLFIAALSMLASLFLGIVPATRLLRSDNAPASAVRQHKLGTSWRVGKPLMVAQISLSLVVLVVSALLARTLMNLQRVTLGFDPANLVLFEVEPLRSVYDRARAAILYEDIDREVRRVPGVRAVSIAGAGSGLLWGQDSNGNVFLEGGSPEGVQKEAKWQFVDLKFFDTMGIRLTRGRPFLLQDTPTAPPVAIVTEAFADTFFGGVNPLGRRFSQQADAPASRQIEIVGVVNDVRVTSLRATAPPMFYRPVAQTGSPSRTVIVRTTRDADQLIAAITDAMRRIDPRLPLRNVRTQERDLGDYTADERALASAAATFGGLSLMVSMIGLFGLMSYSVTRRTREIGIRMAVGASPGHLLLKVLLETMTVAAIGIAIGVVVALFAGRLLSGVVFGVSPYDPASIGVAVALMVVVAAVASFRPAHRAARVDPVVALRSE